MQLLIYILSLFSGTYEMLVLMIAFREFLTWRLATTWCGLTILAIILGQTMTACWPQLPLVIGWIIPITVVNTIMSTQLLDTKWILTLPIVVFLNALKRLIGDLANSLVNWLLNSGTAVRLHQISHLQPLIVNLDLFSVVIMGFPLVILLGLAAHRLVIRTAAADFFQHATIEHSDYLLVLLCYGLYLVAYGYTLNLAVDSQPYVALAASVIFGIVSFYLVSNKNSRLSDAQLLREVSQYNNLLSHRNQQLHLFKHDYQNILLSLSQYIHADDMAGLKHYFEDEVLPNSQPLNVTAAPEQLHFLHAPALSGLIYAKYEAATSRQVDLQLVILAPLDLPQANQVKVVRILGNLLDNAIDAATQVDHQVQLVIEDHSQTVTFSVQNRIPPDDTINLQRISKNRFTTKLGHLGYGLSSIEQLTDQAIKVTYAINEQTFSAHLTLQH